MFWTLNIAACYFYLGESYLLEQEYEQSLSSLYKAFEYCDEQVNYPTSAIILSRLGSVEYHLGHKEASHHKP